MDYHASANVLLVSYQRTQRSVADTSEAVKRPAPEVKAEEMDSRPPLKRRATVKVDTPTLPYTPWPADEAWMPTQAVPVVSHIVDHAEDMETVGADLQRRLSLFRAPPAPLFLNVRVRREIPSHNPPPMCSFTSYAHSLSTLISTPCLVMGTGPRKWARRGPGRSLRPLYHGHAHRAGLPPHRE